MSDSERVVADLRAPRPGPILIVIVGLHGNEPDPREALRAMTQELDVAQSLERGRLVVLQGNMRALAHDRRFIDHDMNRVWTDRRVRGLVERLATGGSSEDREQSELLHAIEEILAERASRLAMLDFHTFSGDGKPFILGSDHASHRELSRTLGLPLVFGLQESLVGTMSGYFDDRCQPCLAVEAGHTGVAATRDNVRAILSRVMAELGMTSGHDLQAGSASAQIFRISYRHPIAESDQFVMEDGFATLMKVERGQLLARDLRGEVLAPHDGWIIMPLYQDIGADGFFIAQREENHS